MTYSEILKLVPVAQSSISLWCKDIKLGQIQIDRIQKIRAEGVKLGARNRHDAATKLKKQIITRATNEIKTVSKKELWLIGIALYWAEGSKQSLKAASQGVKFTNSDPNMIKIFDTWLTQIVKVDLHNINYEIYLHESLSSEKSRVIEYWSNILEKPINKFDRIYLKKNIITKSYSKSDYKGVVRIVVKKSTSLNRQIFGWQQGIIQNCRVV
ncbi:MAG: hypothetical protein UX64_C0025G0004 [Microgenomates group bacterium GW2011_GWC2_46_7]|nr:MAG: hypothetical protein UX64_C0025G0004 [Microgenomates group bacterium GW2011_GWC2_46_7]